MLARAFTASGAPLIDKGRIITLFGVTPLLRIATDSGLTPVREFIQHFHARRANSAESDFVNGPGNHATAARAPDPIT